MLNLLALGAIVCVLAVGVHRRPRQRPSSAKLDLEDREDNLIRV